MAQLKVGEQFTCWIDFIKRLEDFSRQNCLEYVTYYSRTVQLSNKTTGQHFADKMKYAYAKLVCKYYGKGRRTGQGLKRNNGSKKTECPAYIFVSADRKMGCLFVKDAMNIHNHGASQAYDASVEAKLKISEVLKRIELSCVSIDTDELSRRHSILSELLKGWQNTELDAIEGPVSVVKREYDDTAFNRPTVENERLEFSDEQLQARVRELEPELKAIFRGHQECSRHQLYRQGGAARRSLDIYEGLDFLGEGQEDLIMDILLSTFVGRKMSLETTDYCLRVLLPEVVDTIFKSQVI